MIEDGRLVLSSSGGVFQTFRIENRILNALVLAVLTTIIAYQGKALFFDLVLGLKRRGFMTIRDLHIFLLSGESSPLAVLDALLRNDWFTRKRLRGDIPKDATIRRDQNRIRPGTVLKLLSLILVGPIFNIIAISLTLEKDRVYTIGEAGLGGFEVGVNMNREAVDTTEESQYCRRVPLELKHGETAMSSFFFCDLQVPSETNVQPGTAVVRVALMKEAAIFLNVASPTQAIIIGLSGNLRSNGTVYFIKPVLTVDEANLLTEIGAEVIRNACGNMESIGDPANLGNEEYPFVQRVIQCPNNITNGDEFKAMGEMKRAITFKEADTLQVVPFLEIPVDEENETTQYYRADSLPLLRRSRGTASLLVLLVTAGSVVFLRLIARLFAYNDFPIAIEVVLRDRFGLPCLDSMLQNDTPVEYRKTFQLVENAHFGMSSDSLPEVGRIVGGSVE